MAPPKVDVQRGQQVAWSVLALAFLALAAGGPLQMVRASRAAASLSSARSARSTAGAATVHLVGLAFEPDLVAVAKGTQVVFLNDDVTIHTVNGANGGPVDSGQLLPRKAYRVVVNETFDYVCLIHPGMRGRIVVTG